MTYTSDQLLARAAFVDAQIATWKGNAGYADTLRMEAWALRTAAAIAGAGKWMPPITTAPRDGSELLLVSLQPQADNTTYISISNGSFSEEAGIFVLGPKGSRMNEIGDGCATHWLPVDWMFQTPGAAARYRHKARGSTYVEVGRGKLQSFDPGGLSDKEPIVIYRAENDGTLWARPVDEFEDGRFERIGAETLL